MPGSLPITRSRDWIAYFGTQHESAIDARTGSTIYTIVNVVKNPGRQITTSEGHPWPPSKENKSDIGGPFFTQRRWVKQIGKKGDFNSFFNTTIDTISGTIVRHYDGPITPIDPRSAFLWPDTFESSDAELEALGATAIANCKPTNSVAEAAVAIGEIHNDGLPSIPMMNTWRESTLRAKNAGDEFLNVVFGWLPFVSDLKKIRKAIVNADRILTQLERDSGRLVRRSWHFPTKVEESKSSFGPSKTGFGPSDTKFYISPLPDGELIRDRKITRKQSFSGAFTYHIPDGSSYRSKMIRAALKADKLFGLSLTPDVVWNLAPWSWAIDWFSNTGDVISNLSDWATYGLVMRYGYMMEETIVEDTYTLAGPRLKGSHSEFKPITFVVSTKKRVQANPFGFGVSWEGLSPLQLAILAALGISRGR